MFRRVALLRFGMAGTFMTESEERANKKGWKQLFFKPQTRDERIKDYVPEVLEESLAAQRAVLAAENTERDLIVEHGQKMLKDLENKAPVTNMFPAFVALLKLYKQENLLTQRAMHLLMYPSSTVQGVTTQAPLPELVSSFSENFRSYIETIEQNGSYVHDVKWKSDAHQKHLTSSSSSSSPKELLEEGKGPKTTTSDSDVKNKEDSSVTDEDNKQAATTNEKPAEEEEENVEEKDPAAPADEAEPLDVTLYVKCLAGMSLANARLNDKSSAIKCCNAALEHAKDPTRKGGVLALKTGLLVQSKKYLEAVESSRLAIECAPQNPQGYLHGATALRLMGRHDDAVEMLRLGSESLPQNEQIQHFLKKVEAAPKQLGGAESDSKEALPEKTEGETPQVTA